MDGERGRDRARAPSSDRANGAGREQVAEFPAAARQEGDRRIGRRGSKDCGGAEGASGDFGLGAYRIYRIADGGRLVVGEAFDAKDDGEALERAKRLHDGKAPLELWAGGRLVGRLSKLGLFTAGPG